MVLRGIHLIGALLLLASSVLLIVASISAPVVNSLALFQVDVDNVSSGSSLGISGTDFNMGTFGWCLIDGNANGGDACSQASIGYQPFDSLGTIGSGLSNHVTKTVRVLTRVMVLHPIGAGVCFIAALLGLVPGVCGGLLAAFAALVAFIITLVAVACDFAMFAVLRHAINDQVSGGNIAHFGTALWCVLASAVTAFVGFLVLLATCCVGRRDRHRDGKLG